MAKRKVARKTGNRRSASRDNGKQQSPDFASAVSSLKGAWEDGQKTQVANTRGGFVNENVESGQYVAQVAGATTGVSRKGKPYFRMRYTILIGTAECDCVGEELNSYDEVTDEMQRGINKTRIALLMERLVGCGIDLEKYGVEDLAEIAETLSDSQPSIRLGVRTNVSDADESQSGERRVFQTIYANGVYED